MTDETGGGDLAALMVVMPAPSSPVETGGGRSWRSVEEAAGTRLPSDYEAFLRRYGSGMIGDFFSVLNPFSANRWAELNQGSRDLLWALRVVRSGGEPVRHPIHPEAGGVFPWGVTDNGDVLYWVTGADPDRWSVTVNESRGREWFDVETTMTAFLLALVSGAIRVPMFPDDFDATGATFTPMST